MIVPVILSGGDETRLWTLSRKLYPKTIYQSGQSTYIPQGSLHRLENHQDIPLEIIEIQTGNYLGEDDIIRLEDDYQRN